MLPEYIYDAVQVENNPITIPEINTLVAGITIGGHRISDVQQIINLNNSWKYLIESLKSKTFSVERDFSNKLHGYLGKDEALEWGTFRNGSISIAGTKYYKCPESTQLNDIYNNDIKWVMSSDNPIENAL
jgi:Fic family protein